jgi:hypothetical protein
VTIFTELASRLPLSALLQVHVAVLVATSVFVGFSHVVVASSQPDPRQGISSYRSRLRAVKVLERSGAVAYLCVLGILSTIGMAGMSGPLPNLVSAGIVAAESIGMVILLRSAIGAINRDGSSDVD